LRTELEKRLGEQFISLMEMILDKFHRLYEYKVNLEKQSKEKENIPQFQAETQETITKNEKEISEL
jgi:hypothetical protein